MPTTERGLTYPDSTGHTRLWEHLQTLAQNAEAALDALDAAPLAAMWKTAAQSTVSAAVTKVTFPLAENADNPVDGITADTAASEFTITRAGVYDFNAYLAFASHATGYRGFIIYRIPNGGAQTIVASDYRPAVNGTATIATVSALGVPCGVGDRLFCSMVQTSGTALDISNANGAGRFSAQYRRALPT